MIRKPLTTIKTLPTKLSREERDDRARALAVNTADKMRVTTEAKVAAGAYKEQLKDIDKQIIRLMDATNNGVEDREVECDIRLDGNVAHVTRRDTFEIVEVRPATKAELHTLQTSIYDLEGVK
jgi:uncharacterized FlaG/YvyC family protein